MTMESGRTVASASWDGHRRFAIAAIAVAVVLTLLSPPIGAVVDVVVAVWAHRVGEKFARNALLVLAAAAVVWILLGIGSGSSSIHPAT
jgi:hypothetical protein